SQSRMSANLWLLGASFTFFIFSVNINPNLIKNDIFLSLQITLAIPMFITSVFARNKLAFTEYPEKWDLYGFVTFIFGYTFLINVIGILLSNLVGLVIGLIFFGANILSDLLYSYIDLSEKKHWIKYIYKDLLYMLILIFGGILPSLNVY
ncbi:hypothetical protein ACFLTH_13645, partial [Bacteroidota bacterium]